MASAPLAVLERSHLVCPDVVVTRNVDSEGDNLPLQLTALCPLGVGGSQEGECIPLNENTSQVWTLSEDIVL